MRNYKLDNIRAVAIFAVVFGHSIILYSSTWNTYEPTAGCLAFDYIKRFINIFQMPLFFSLSGYLLSLRGINSGFVSFMLKKSIRLAIPLLFVGIGLMIPIKILIQHPSYVDVGFWTAVKMLINGKEAGHLWYLPTLLLIFVYAYWTIRLSKKFPYMLVCIFLLSIVLHYCRRYLPSLGIPYQQRARQYLWCFLFGAVIHAYSLENSLQKYKHGIAFLTVCICALNIVFTRTDLFASLMSVLTIYLWIPNRECCLGLYLSKNSFGIYLFHSLLIYFTFTFFLNASPLIVVGINFFVCGGLAFAATQMIRKTKFKFLIGE